MKKYWLSIVWDVVRITILIVLSIIILNNAPQWMNEPSWFYYWLGLIGQIFGFILLGYSIFDIYKSGKKYYKELVK